MAKKRVVILGSTGSIGKNTLDVIKHTSTDFEVLGLATNRNIELLLEQVAEFEPEFIAIGDKEKAKEIKDKIKIIKKNINIFVGEEGIIELAKMGDLVVIAQSTSSALLPTIEAIKNNKTICLANKEIMVMCGNLIMKLAKEHKAKIIPIDSELCAIFQCIEKINKDDIKRIILTGSGGPLRKKDIDLEKVDVEEVLKHPCWQMGKKITVDSATLMNKGFEVIETHYIFEIPVEKISILIHPEAIIHSMVELIDNVILAQLAITDMRIPIAYGLYYPKRMNSYLEQLDLVKIGKLTFEEIQMDRFPCLKLAIEAIKIGGSMPTVLNAANEVAVNKFLNREITFLQINQLINAVINKHTLQKEPTLEEIIEIDKWARKETELEAKKLAP